MGAATGTLAGKVALVTGAARGLGRGYALRLAELGADVATVDRNLDGAAVYEFERRRMTAACIREFEPAAARQPPASGLVTSRKVTRLEVATSTTVVTAAVSA